MSSFEFCGRNDFSAVFSFPPDFPGFQGHFPGNPVLPAVCILQAVMVMASKCSGNNVKLMKVSSAKWFTPTGPDSKLGVRVHVTPDEDGRSTFRAKVSRGNDKVADLILNVSGFDQEGEEHQ